MVDFSLTPKQQEWVDKAKKLAAVFAIRARKYDEAGEFPAENFELLREEGFLKLAVPSEFGGLGDMAGYNAFIPHLVVETVSAACGTTGWGLVTHYHHCGLLAGLGDDEQRSRIFADVVGRGALMASLGSEVNPQQMKTAAQTTGQMRFNAELTPAPGGFVVSAQKGFCSMARVSDYCVYWAMAPGTQTLSDGLVLSIVPMDSPGLTFLPGWEDAMGIRGSHSGGVKVENVFIPWRNVLGEPGDYVQKYPHTFDLTYTVLLLGIAQGAYDFVRKALAERSFLQKDDTVMYTVGEMSSALQATRMSWWYAQWLWEQRRWDDAMHATLRALHTAKETSMLVTTKSFELLGVRAIFKFNPLERAWRDVRTVTLHTRESLFMRLVANGDITGEKFVKEKYGPRLKPHERKTWADLGYPRDPVRAMPSHASVVRSE
jgi:alkylation response protein AidB-like acyl-CoA dehydrogenase